MRAHFGSKTVRHGEGGRLRRGNNPVLRWRASNVATESQTGPAEAVLKCSKKKSTEKIDGIVAICEALAVSMLNPADYQLVPGSLSL